ncbi:hypothetical protein HCA00_00560 [Listeria booriae]|uniref:Transcriptional regulator n=1 Tax=Listeria booriae TaxID=1552123 RepID=A0A7X1D923_9LIST|nr:hypothetical protein [Listeria booriae]MBC1651080.1 hypothetical protein [Listeria booriae]MBC1918822.1 hypothetical protein [Listeria booriae]MBC2177233.1 hypothetical protein [Listeria booriae]MBC2207059.1 hypothetical protein [Listeria booriae]MBC2243658.1 hypothetical protein [Listeria booriae]
MTTATKTMPKEIYRYIEHEIINYPRMIDRINELTRKQQKNLHPPCNTLYLDTRIERLSTVVQCIENVIRNLNSLGDPYHEFIELRYWRTNSNQTMEGIAQKIHVSRRTAYNMQNRIVQMVASELGEWQ